MTDEELDKKAKEYAIDNYETCLYDNLPYLDDSRAREQSFKDGVKFGFSNANEWHYIAEEGLPTEADKYYFIAYQTALGLSGSYCKLVEEKIPIVPGYGHVTGYNTIKQWDCSDSEVKAWMNEAGRVYAWKSLPDLPEYREYK